MTKVRLHVSAKPPVSCVHALKRHHRLCADATDVKNARRKLPMHPRVFFMLNLYVLLLLLVFGVLSLRVASPGPGSMKIGSSSTNVVYIWSPIQIRSIMNLIRGIVSNTQNPTVHWPRTVVHKRAKRERATQVRSGLSKHQASATRR